MAIGGDEIILHHYDSSPFSEKIRLLLGLKGLAWRSVIQPTIMPKPELTPLTGGYRRAPVMQIGADVFCDSQVILAELDRRGSGPSANRGAAFAVNLWADRLFFGATVPIIFGEIGDNVPKAFMDDREKLSGRPFDVVAMRSAGQVLNSQREVGWIWTKPGATPAATSCCASSAVTLVAASAPSISSSAFSSSAG